MLLILHWVSHGINNCHPLQGPPYVLALDSPQAYKVSPEKLRCEQFESTSEH